MFPTSKLSIVSALAFAATALAQTFSIATPASLIQCQPVQITWTGGTSPFILAVIPGGQTGAAAIETISSTLTSSPTTWTVNLASGTYLTLKLTDATGTIAYSSPLTIQAGVSNSCLNSTAVTSGVVTSAVTTTVSGSSTVSGTASGTSSTPTSSTSVSSMASSSAASSAATGASSVVSAASSAVSSVAATTSKASGASKTVMFGVPALALAAVGGVAMLL